MAVSRRPAHLVPASPETIAAAAACLRGGGLVATPTETVYGLAADATSDGAVAEIFAAKGRPAFNPLIAHVLDIEEARRHAIFGEDAERLAQTFWPGPLTLVLPVASACRVSLLARAGLDSLAVRAPAHPVARGLIEAAGVPLAAPSANRSGRVSPTTAAHVLADLDGRIDWILDAGPSRHGLEIDDRRLPRRADAASPRRDPTRSDRGGARTSARFGRGVGKGAERAGAARIALRAPRPYPARRRSSGTRGSRARFRRGARGRPDAGPARPFAVRRSRRGGVESVRPSAGSGCVRSANHSGGPYSAPRVGRGDQRPASSGGGAERRLRGSAAPGKLSVAIPSTESPSRYKLIRLLQKLVRPL